MVFGAPYSCELPWSLVHGRDAENLFLFYLRRKEVFPMLNVYNELHRLLEAVLSLLIAIVLLLLLLLN